MSSVGTPPLQRLSLTPHTLAKVIKSKVRSTERPAQASPLVADPTTVLLPPSRDFSIRRTAANWLPVYRDFRHHNRILTKIRLIEGNVSVCVAYPLDERVHQGIKQCLI
jgi:hypothetical protein